MSSRTRLWTITLAALVAGLALTTQASAALATYRATFVADVKFAGKYYHNASLRISFIGDTALVTEVPGFTGADANCFFWIPNGQAAVQIVSQGRTLAAQFLPNQLFVSVDSCNLGFGIGSYTGPTGLEPGYPIAFARGTTGNSAFGLAAALTQELNSTGNAWSCIGYPPTLIGTDNMGNGECYSPDLYPLHTDHGDLVIYMNYTVPAPFPSSRSSSLNRGTFSIWLGVATKN